MCKLKLGSGHSHQRYIWEKTAAFGENTMPTIKPGGGNIVAWSCVEVSGTGNTAPLDVRIDSTKYKPILNMNVNQSGLGNKLGAAHATMIIFSACLLQWLYLFLFTAEINKICHLPRGLQTLAYNCNL